MSPEELLSILSQAARLKTTTRHCYTEGDRKESVADHSWRIALMAMLMTGVEDDLFNRWVDSFPEPQRTEWTRRKIREEALHDPLTVDTEQFE